MLKGKSFTSYPPWCTKLTELSAGDVSKAVKDGTCKSIGDVKSCTKAGTGCGGCMPLIQTIFNKTMASMGQEVKNHLCPHFEYSRAVRISKQRTAIGD